MSGKISVFGCGVQKGGTTSLYAHFCDHPDLSAAAGKEIHFFDDETQDWSAPEYQALDAFFPDGERHGLRCDITPIYSFWQPSIARIHAYNPQAKLIYLFRDPFERAWSHWCMEYAKRKERLPFAVAIRAGRNRITDLPPLADERRVYTYVERGFYAEQVRRALRYFPRNQMLFLRSEDLRDDHAATLRRISDFLRISPFPDTGPKREHSRPDRKYPSVPTQEDRLLVSELVSEDLRSFAVLTGLDISGWPTAANA